MRSRSIRASSLHFCGCRVDRAGVRSCAGAVVVESKLQQRAQGRRQGFEHDVTRRSRSERARGLRSRSGVDAPGGRRVVDQELRQPSARRSGLQSQECRCESTSRLPRTRYPERNQSAVFYKQLLDRVGALPGVESAGAVSSLPAQRRAGPTATSRLRASPPVEPDRRPVAWYSSVTPGLLSRDGHPVAVAAASFGNPTTPTLQRSW